MKIKKSVSILVVCLSAIFVLAACDGGEAPENINYYDLEVKVGEEFEITLKANYTTPCRWEYKVSKNSGVECVAEDYIPNEHEPDVVGSGGRMCYTFEAMKIGKYEIRFDLKDFGEKNSPLLERNIYKITVIE